MLKKTKQGYYIFEEFEQKKLIHGFSTRKFDGKKLLAALNLKKENLVLMEQVHGNKIKMIGKKDKGKVIPGVDGLITQAPRLILGVRTADCLPVLFCDRQRQIIAAIHAGWRGVLQKIIQKTVDLLIQKGARPEEVLVGIGPYICGDCYVVDKQRAQKFIQTFGNLKKMVLTDEKGIHLDLRVPLMLQLIHSGVLEKNIFSANVCTSCQNQKFFSYRKDSAETYGEMLSIISLNI